MKGYEAATVVEPSAYVPVEGDFELLVQEDIGTDTNYASQGYWKGVATHFMHNKRAMVGLCIVLLLIRRRKKAEN